MYSMTQGQIEEPFINWLRAEEVRLRALEREGYSRQEAIEMLKVFRLASIDSSIGYLR